MISARPLQGTLEHRRAADVCRTLLEGASDPAATVAVLCDRSSLGVAVALAEHDPRATVMVFLKDEAADGPALGPLPPNCTFGTGADAHARVLELATLPRSPSLVLEFDGRPGRSFRSAFPVFFGAVADGGHYVLLDNDRPVPHPLADEAPVTVRDLAQWYVENAENVTEQHGRWAPELGRSIGAVRVDGDLTLVTKRGDHLFKLDPDEMERIGPRRWGEQWSDVLVRRPAYEFTMPGRLTLANAGPVTADRRQISVPERVLRRHRDVTLSRRMLVRKDNVALAESFHHPHQVNLRHPRLADITRKLGRDLGRGPVRELEGSHFLLDTAYPGHFGHVTTEVLGMMWGWLELQERGIAARPLVSTYVEKPELPAFQFEVFEAFGIARDDIEIVPGRDIVRVPELYTASQQIESPRWIDRDITETWQRLRTHLRGRAAETGVTGLGAERVFVSRRDGAKRNCVNAAEVEDFFRSRGFTVYFPEDHAYLHQVETFARAGRVAGFGGSGMFNLMFTAPRTPLLVLTSDGYSATNELLLAAANGNDLTYVWGPAERRPTQMGRHDRASFRANYVIDLRAHRAALRRFTSRLRLHG